MKVTTIFESRCACTLCLFERSMKHHQFRLYTFTIIHRSSSVGLIRTTLPPSICKPMLLKARRKSWTHESFEESNWSEDEIDIAENHWYLRNYKIIVSSESSKENATTRGSLHPTSTPCSNLPLGPYIFLPAPRFPGRDQSSS